jgi:flotillin
MQTLFFALGIPILLVVIAVLVIGFAFSRMYKRSTREVSLVKTGTGGRKVIIDGGTLVIPVLHEITRINMTTTRLEVRRSGESALITRDRMRADVGVEFYVTVQASEEGIARAAQTLGARTFNPNALREMVEGKLVDGLRSVAAKMDIDDLHENRASFVQQVQQAVSEDLKKNGLELESVSLTALDQTPLEGLAENNVFNAAGLQVQAHRIAESRKRRAEIEADAEVSVARAKQDAEIRKYEIERTQEEARVAQAIELEGMRAREEIDRAKRTEESSRAAEEARIEREEAIQTAEIARKRAIELAEQERQIAIQKKSEEESRARAAADLARAEAVKAAESIETERRVAMAERDKRTTVIKAEEEAERGATSIRVAAKAERDAANDRAAAMDELARAEANQITIRADADRTAKLAEADGLRALNEAEASLDPRVIEFRLARERLAVLPEIMAQMVKPAEKIGSITIHKVDGLGMAGASGAASGGTSGGEGRGLVNQAFDEIRAMSFQAPALAAVGKAVGISLGKPMDEMMGEVLGFQDPQTSPEVKAKVRKAAGAVARKSAGEPAAEA